MRTAMWKGLVVGAALVLPVAACDVDNPIDEGQEDVARLEFDRSYATIIPGDSTTLTVRPRNRYNDPIRTSVSFSACDSNVTLSDPIEDLSLAGQTSVTVYAGTTLGYSCVVASAGGQQDTVQILVVPDYLVPGSSTAAPGGRVVLNRAIGQPVFDDNVAISVDGYTAFWSRTESSADSLVFWVPFGVAAGDVTVDVSNIGPGNVTIPATLTISGTATDPHEPNDYVFGGGEIFPVSAPEFELVSMLDASDTDDFFEFTLTEETTFDMLLDWDDSNGSGDLDLYVADIGFNVAYCTSATGDHPEDHVEECTLPAGDYLIWVTDYTPGQTTTYYLTMSEH